MTQTQLLAVTAFGLVLIGIACVIHAVRLARIARDQFREDLIQKLRQNRWGLAPSALAKNMWVVFTLDQGTGKPSRVISCAERWELAIQDAERPPKPLGTGDLGAKLAAHEIHRRLVE